MQMFSILQSVPVFVVVKTLVVSGLGIPGLTIGSKLELTISNSRITGANFIGKKFRLR